MNILFLTQFACFVVSGMLALFLILTRFQIRWPNHRYEVSRWLMCGAMLALTFHFVLQMAFDIRAKSDAIGAVVNILFYAPIEYLMSYSTFNLICYSSGRKRIGLLCSLSYALIIICFLMGGYRGCTQGQHACRFLAVSDAGYLYPHSHLLHHRYLS